LGAFESGATAAAFGAVASVVGGGVGTVVVVLLVLWRWPQLWRLGPLHGVRPFVVPAGATDFAPQPDGADTSAAITERVPDGTGVGSVQAE
jgi:hypothetical protein